MSSPKVRPERCVPTTLYSNTSAVDFRVQRIACGHGTAFEKAKNAAWQQAPHGAGNVDIAAIAARKAGVSAFEP